MSEFHPNTFGPELHGLALYHDVANCQLHAFGLSPDDGDLEVLDTMRKLRSMAITYSVTLPEAAAEAIALAIQCGQPDKAAIMAQAIHLLHGDRFFLMKREPGARSKDTSYDALSFVTTMGEAYAYSQGLVASLSRKAAR